MSLNGIDISNWQNNINLSVIKTDFIIVKSSEGIGWTDPSFKKLFKAAKATGKKLGVYHFARPTANNDPVEEADSFISSIKTENVIGNAILVLDWEAENKHNTEWAKKWLDRVYAKTRVKPFIYMSESVVNAYNWSAIANAGYELWVAKYRDSKNDYNFDMSLAGTPPSVKYWKSYKMWQWTSSGRLDGFNSNLDCNIFYGNEADWDKFAKGDVMSGWKKEGIYWYYYKNNKKITGWQKLDWSKGSNWFYFNKDGKMLTGWQKLDWSKGNDWFYFDENGVMLTGWQKLKWSKGIDWFCFDEKSGAMKYNTTINAEITFNENGALEKII